MTLNKQSNKMKILFEKIKKLLSIIKPFISNFYNTYSDSYSLLMIFPMLLIFIILIYFIVLVILGFLDINIVLPKGVLYWLTSFFVFLTYSSLFLATIINFSKDDTKNICQDNILPTIISNLLRSSHLIWYSLGLVVGSSILFGLYKHTCGGNNYNLTWGVNIYDYISIFLIISCIIFSILKIFKTELSSYCFPFMFFVLSIVYLCFKFLIFYIMDFISNIINYLTTVWVFKGNVSKNCSDEKCDSDIDKDNAYYLLITPIVVIFSIAIVILQVCPPFWIFTAFYKANTTIHDMIETGSDYLYNKITKS